MYRPFNQQHRRNNRTIQKYKRASSVLCKSVKLNQPHPNILKKIVISSLHTKAVSGQMSEKFYSAILFIAKLCGGREKRVPSARVRWITGDLSWMFRGFRLKPIENLIILLKKNEVN